MNVFYRIRDYAVLYKAKYWNIQADRQVQCELCPHRCLLKPGQAGKCKSRTNIDGSLYADNYAAVVAIHSDPIEKKPLYHYYPGENILSIGTYGCNLACDFCQNSTISQFKTSSQTLLPEKLLELCVKYLSLGVAYTYTEPLTWLEYLIDCCKLLHENNLKNIIVSNGVINKEPLEELIPYLDAANFDLKSFNPDFYREYCDGFLKPVLHTIKTAFEHGVWVEITNLVIPTLNEDINYFKDMISWIADISPYIPLHLSRYYPSHKRTTRPTTPELLMKLANIAQEKLAYVYLGNLHIKSTTNTFCPECHSLLIEREGYLTKVSGLNDDHCTKCNRKFDGVMGD